MTSDQCRDTMIQMGIRPGVKISMVTDPDGNWVEFVDDTTL